MGLGGQVQSEAVAAGISQLGQGTLAVAGDKQVIEVLADDLSGLDGADRLGGVAGTAEVDQQGGLGAGQGVLGVGDDVSGSVGLALEVVLLVQGMVQGVADELTGAGAGQNDVEILGLDNLIQELLQLILARCQLSAGLAPGSGLLIDLVNGESRGSCVHLLFGVVENAHFLYIPPVYYLAKLLYHSAYSKTRSKLKGATKRSKYANHFYTACAIISTV